MGKLPTEVIAALREENRQLRKELELAEADRASSDALQKTVAELYRACVLLGRKLPRSSIRGSAESTRKEVVAIFSCLGLRVPAEIRTHKRRKKHKKVASVGGT